MRGLNLRRWRLRPRLQPKTRGQWRLGRVREGGVVVVDVVVVVIVVVVVVKKPN